MENRAWLQKVGMAADSLREHIGNAECILLAIELVLAEEDVGGSAMERRTENILLDTTQVSRLVKKAVPDAVVKHSALLLGGRANTNYRVETERGPLVLRLYARDAAARDKEAALLGGMDDVPVPSVLGIGESEFAPYAVLSWCSGYSLAAACTGFGAAEWTTAGRSLGRALAKIHAHAFQAPGELRGTRSAGAWASTVEPWPFDGLLGFMRGCLANGPAARRLGSARQDALQQLIADSQYEAHACVLTHGDFNATNILVDDTGRLTAVLDWEFAHAGDPLMDLGNLLRDAPDRNPPLPDAFIEALIAERSLPVDWREHARFVDLANALELLSSGPDRPVAHAHALRQIDGVIRAASFSCTRVRLRSATLDDVDLLRHWEEQPHVIAAAPNDAWEWEQELARNPSWRELLIAEVDGRPMGFIQILDPAREDSHYWGECPDDLRAIDIWIGEELDLGKGYGTRMMQLALERCFHDPAVRAVLVDPLQSNTRARRFYERFGFRFVENRRFGEDDCAVYRLARATFCRQQRA